MGLMRFRVWHKDDKVMLSNHLGFMITDTGQLLIESMLGDEETMEKVELDNYIVMQSTGLKDKNGVEIYEGDILEVEKNEDGTYKGTINGKTFFDRFQGYSSKIKVEGMHDINTLRYWNNRVRIIGNIYENPELLEEI